MTLSCLGGNLKGKVIRWSTSVKKDVASLPFLVR